MKISKKLFLTFLCFPIFSQATVLLLPDTNISFSSYQEKCIKGGYQCTYNYLQNWVVSQPTPLFDNFINSVDLSTSQFRQTALSQLQNILMEEMISEDQLDLILVFIKQLREENNLNNKISLLEKSLLQTKELLQNTKPLNQLDYEYYIIVMKKPIPKSNIKKLSMSLLRLPYYEINFRQFPQLIKKNKSLASENLVQGFCEKAQVHELVQSENWQIQHEKSCSFNEQIRTMTSATSAKIIENKNWILTGALLIGAAVLMSQYEVKFQF